jgi:nucleoside-diphosphate-sugar epimerase
LKQALVTGGAGFIGSHLTEILIQDGFRVKVYDDLRLGSIDNVPSAANFIEGDIRNSKLLDSEMQGAEYVFHLAAESRNLPSLGFEAAKLNLDVNINGTLNVILSALNHKVKNVIYSASSTMYGRNKSPQIETMLPDTLTPYAASKYSGELLFKTFNNLYGLSSHCLRYFQVFGPRQPSSGPYALVTGIFLKQWKENKPLTIEGDGSQTRDFVHVLDVAEANLRASQVIGCGDPINIGTGSSTSIKALANMISENQIHIEARKFDLPGTQADTQKCRDIFGWIPTRNIKAEIDHQKLQK